MAGTRSGYGGAVQAPRPESAFPEAAPTSETAWRALVAELPELVVSASAVTVVAPHPDDETLACGGLIADLISQGVAVDVVGVTDGDGSHLDRPGLAERRRAEQDEALAILGVQAAVRRLHLDDGKVAASIERLTAVLTEVAEDGHLLVAPWELDGHTDHDACGRAARRAGEASGARLLQYPVWAWQWAQPCDFAAVALCRRTISEASASRKRAAMRSFPTQTSEQEGEVIVTPTMLERFGRPWEVFVDG